MRERERDKVRMKHVIVEYLEYEYILFSWQESIAIHRALTRLT